jgi:hypothetical protein
MIFSKNFWVVAFPCLVYLGSLAMGIVYVYQNAMTLTSEWSTIPYLSISLSLNVMLTLMIVIRLVLHVRNTRAAMGVTGMGGMCNPIITMLIESCALYSVSLALVIGPWAADNFITDFFVFILPQTQVIAPLLIIQRVADKSALTSETVVSGRISEFRARTLVWSSGGGALRSGATTNSLDRRGVSSSELGVGAETTINFYREKV